MNESELYQECVHALVGEPELEHLLSERKIEREIDQQLWELVCDLAINRHLYKDRRKQYERLQLFVDVITRSHEDYEVLFAVEHLRIDQGELAIGGVTFFHFDVERAAHWGIPDDRREAYLIGKTVGRVCVQAGSFKKAVERAKEKVDTALSFLRVAGTPMRFIHDDQLRQRRGQEYAAKNLSSTLKSVLQGWELGPNAFNLELRGHVQTQLSENLVWLQPVIRGAIAGDIGVRLLRAVEWVSSSITRERDDDRVVDLCTAMETLLVTKDEQRKGEAVSLRVLLLAMAGERGWLLLHPLEVLRLYELRSYVIHGSARNICTKRDYQMLRQVVLGAMQDIVHLAISNQQMTKLSNLTAMLQHEARLQKAVAWISETSDPEDEGLKELLSCAEHWLNPRKP